jgi:hypothetical protein
VAEHGLAIGNGEQRVDQSAEDRKLVERVLDLGDGAREGRLPDLSRPQQDDGRLEREIVQGPRDDATVYCSADLICDVGFERRDSGIP